MSNFLVPSSVVARRKNTQSRPRPNSRGSVNSDDRSPGVSPRVPAPPGFAVPLGTPSLPVVSDSNHHTPQDTVSMGVLSGSLLPGFATPVTPSPSDHSIPKGEEDLIAFANSSIGGTKPHMQAPTTKETTRSESADLVSTAKDFEGTIDEDETLPKDENSTEAKNVTSVSSTTSTIRKESTQSKALVNENMEELGKSTGIGQWDQFRANRELFQVPGIFDETYYTTELDTSNLDPQKITEAERLAREIETNLPATSSSLARTVAKKSLEGSPFHLDLASRLKNNHNGLSIAQVKDMLEEHPEIDNLFYNIKSQYDVRPAQLLRELSNVRVENIKGEDRCFYWEPPTVPISREAVTTTIAAKTGATKDNNGDNDVVDSWEDMLSDDEADGKATDKAVSGFDITQSTLNEETGGNDGPSSSSTSPTTVTTASSADTGDHVTAGKEPHQLNKEKVSVNEASAEVLNCEQEKSNASVVEVCQEPSIETLTEEDRNDGDDKLLNDKESNENRGRERDDGPNNIRDTEIAPTKTQDSGRESSEPNRKRLAPVSIITTPTSRISGATPQSKTEKTPVDRKSPQQDGNVQSIDAMAALEFLSMLHEEIEDGTNEWPEDQAQLKLFLTKVTNCCFSKNADGVTRDQLPRVFRSWFERIVQRHKKDAKRLNKVRREATASILKQLEALEVVECTSILLWRKRRIETVVFEHRQKDWRGPNKKGPASEKPSASRKKGNNLWQNPRKIKALVSGYQPNQKSSASTEKSPKTSLGMVVLKKTSGRSSGKTILNSPLPPTPMTQQNNSSTTPSPRKVATPGSLNQAQGTVATKKGQDTCQTVARSNLSALRPLAVPARPGAASASRPMTQERKSSSSCSQTPDFVTPSSSPVMFSQHPTSAHCFGASNINSSIATSSWQSGSGQVLSTGAFQHVQAAAQTRDSSTLSEAGLNLPNFDAPRVRATAPTSAGFARESIHRARVCSDDMNVLLDLLPDYIANELSDTRLQNQLTDILLDKGRQPVVWASGTRKFLGAGSRTVTSEDLDLIVERLGGFGESNRVGLDGFLHSVSAIRNRKNDVIGLSIRVGRHIPGVADMISDLLFDDPSKSVLILGENNSGKTTILRDITRLLAADSEVMIVDTVNEVAGDGDTPHSCVGAARRMMVPSLAEQGSVMEECIQNHTLDVMVVDKLGHPDEVEAARTCKDQDVRLIASINGNLRKLVKNGKLQGLLGVEKAGLRPGSKSEMKRTSLPVFDIIVELCPGSQNEWKIILDTADAVDTLLKGEKPRCQIRVRDPDTGLFAETSVEI